jgi:hypothetical protein
MKFQAVGVAVALLLCSPAWAVDLAVEKIATQITARSASRNVFKIEDVASAHAERDQLSGGTQGRGV